MNITKLIQHFLISAVIFSLGIAQDFSAYIHVTADMTEYDLKFGFSPDATDGYDGAYCSNEVYTLKDNCIEAGYEWRVDTAFDLYAPPQPPLPAFDAALVWNGERYYAQIVNGSENDLVEHEWEIQLQFPPSNEILLTWANPGWGVLMESVILEDAFGLGLINVDMTEENSLTLTNPAFTTLKLKVTPLVDAGPFVGPTASFSVAPLSGDAGSTEFIFNSESSIPGDAPIGAWSWFFGDGTYSTDQNPAHIFQSGGSYTVVLRVTDMNGQTDSDTLETPIEVVGIPPVADAGSDTSVFELSELTLSGGGSYDPDGEIVSYKWYVTGDWTTVLSNSNAYAFEVPEYDLNGNNVYSYTLRVDDNDGDYDIDQIKVTVENLEVAPVADAGEDDSGFESYEYQLDGSGSSDDMEVHGHEITYLWTADENIIFNDNTIEKPIITLPEVIEDTPYNISLTVTDNDNLSDSDDVIITIRNIPPGFPLANAGPDQTVDERQVVTMDGSSSNDQTEREIVSYLWTSSDPESIVFNNENDEITTFLAPEVIDDTEFVITLTVTDNDENELTDIAIVTVLNVPLPPVVSITRFCANVNAESPDTLDLVDTFADTLFVTDDDTMYLEVSAADLNGVIVSYEWSSDPDLDFMGLIEFEQQGLDRTNFSLDVSPVLGYNTFTIQSTVTDTEALTTSTDILVTVDFINKRPTAIFGQDSLSLVEGSDILVDGSGSSDPDGEDLTFQWSVPDGLSFSDHNGEQPMLLASQVSADTTYTITMFVSDGELDSEPDTVNVTVVNNTPPLADGGPDQEVYQGTQVELDGSDSSDDTDVSSTFGDLTYSWMAPEGITLVDNQNAKPTFIAPIVSDSADFVFVLIVNDGEFSSDPDTVLVIVLGDVAPDADAGPDQAVVEGHEVTLSGSGSSDSNDDALSFVWESLDEIELSSYSASSPRFFAPPSDSSDDYSFSLSVSDGVFQSSIDTVTVTVNTNTPPVANAGNNFTVYRGETVTLNGSDSDETDVTVVHGAVQYSWTSPDTDNTGLPVSIDLSDPHVNIPTFIAPFVSDSADFIFVLTVNDGEYVSDPDTVLMTTLGNGAPEANAGNNQSLEEGSMVQLDGSGSSDVNGDELTFRWTAPDEITVFNDSIPNPEFILPTKESTEYRSYLFTLIVNDGELDSDPDEVTIFGKANAPPFPNNSDLGGIAGMDITADQGTTVTLSANANDDFTIATDLIYNWSAPSAFILDGADTEAPTFTAPDRDEATDYEVTLTVSDGDTLTAPDTMVVTIFENRPPLATAGVLDADGDVEEDMLEVDQGKMVTLDGTESSDPNNDQLSYEWSLWSSADPEDLNGVWNVGEAFIDCNGDQSICEGNSQWADTLGNNEYDFDEDWTDHKFQLSGQGKVVRPTFIAPDRDEISYYVFYLVVNDGELDSEPENTGRSPEEEKVTIKVLPNKPPVADAGNPKRGLSGNRILLVGSGSRDPNNDPLTYSWTSKSEEIVILDPTLKKTSIILPPVTDGEDRNFIFSLIVFDDEGMISEEDSVTIVAVGHLPAPPDPPSLNVTSDHGIVNLSWDKSSELSLDPFAGYADFEGYRVYRSTDGGNTWGDPDNMIFDYNGTFVGWEPLAQFDLTEEQDSLRCLYSDQYTGCEEIRGVSISGFDPLAQRVNLGSNNGLSHSFTDSNVVDGIEYTYVITAYDIGLRTYKTEYHDDDGDGIFYDSIIWSNSNPLHFVSWDSLTQEEIGLPSLESPFGTSSSDPNFVQVIPGYYSSNITFPDPQNVTEFIVPVDGTIGNGNQFYTIVSEDSLTDALYHLEIQAEFIMNDLNGDGIIEVQPPDTVSEAINIFEGLATEDPTLYIYEISDTTDRVPVESIKIYLTATTNIDSLLDLPGAKWTDPDSILLPVYKLDAFPLRYLDDVDYRSNWTDFFDGIRLRFDNAIRDIPQDKVAILSQKFSLPDSGLIDLLDIELKYTQATETFYRRPAYSYKIEFGSGIIDTANYTAPFASGTHWCEEYGFPTFTVLPFKITNLTTGKHVPVWVTDKGPGGLGKPTAPIPGFKDCVWQKDESIAFYLDTITSALGKDGRLNTEDDTLEYPEYTFNLKIDFFDGLYYLLLGVAPDVWESSRQYGRNEYVFHHAMVYTATEVALPGLKPSAWYDPDGDGVNDNPWKMVYPWQDGDYIIIEPTRWYVDGDSWTADLSKLGEVKPVSQEMLEEITVVPNPYFAQSRFESMENLNHRLRFTHLPQECRISIFTMTGELVRVISHYDEYNSNEWWDLTNGRGQFISPGLYIYVVETPSPSSLKHIGKFVVVR